MQSSETKLTAVCARILLTDRSAVYKTERFLQEVKDLAGVDGFFRVFHEKGDVVRPGVIHMSGDIFRVVFGPRTPEEYRPELAQVERDLRDCGIQGELSRDIQRDALLKFSVVSPMAACGIYHNIQVAGMQTPGQPREDFKELVAEIGALAAAMGHPFPEDPVSRSLAIQDALDPDASTSLKRDLDAGKPSEVDGLIFEVVRLGRQYGVPTPMYDRVAAKLGFNLEE